MTKISIVTATFNSADTIHQTMVSLYDQVNCKLQHVIVDGGSTDETLRVIGEKPFHNRIIISEKDRGIYDALNKGGGYSDGNVIGMLHSDDRFAEHDVLSHIWSTMEANSLDLLYGDLVYVNKKNQVVRSWVGGEYSPSLLKRGWMPPHPTVFVRGWVAKKYPYSLSYKIASDYDWILRVMSDRRVKVGYTPRVIAEMMVGGASNGSLGRVYQKTCEDMVISRRRGIGPWGILMKNIVKLPQLWHRINGGNL